MVKTKTLEFSSCGLSPCFTLHNGVTLSLGLRLSLCKMVPTHGCSTDAMSFGPGAVAVLISPMVCVTCFFSVSPNQEDAKKTGGKNVFFSWIGPLLWCFFKLVMFGWC